MAGKKKDFSGINLSMAPAYAASKKKPEGAQTLEVTLTDVTQPPYTVPVTITTQPQTGSKVFASIEQATSRKGQQGTASPQEAAQRKEQMRTQGRKGVKAERINMAFSDSNYQFIRVMARATGKTMTEFTNAIISEYQREHPELMEQAQALLNFSNIFGGND